MAQPVPNKRLKSEDKVTTMSIDDKLSAMEAFLDSISEQILTKREKKQLQTYMAWAVELRAVPPNQNGLSQANRDLLSELIGITKGFLKTDSRRQSKASAKQNNRVAPLDFSIAESEMKYKHDLQSFLDKVDQLFHWHEQKNIQETFMAPYFPLIQSSGTGKTKLLYEARLILQTLPDCWTELILCHDQAEPPYLTSGKVFSTTLRTDVAPSDLQRNAVHQFLDNIVTMVKNEGKSKLILFFDESQFLTGQDNGWYFRAIRWWLKKSRKDIKVVAVFAGTTAKIANFYADPPESTTSRDAQDDSYYGGNSLYEPFFQLTTTGLCAFEISREKDRQFPSEYHQSIFYGRPLFARMEQKGELTAKIPTVTRRMLGNNNWKTDSGTCFAILGTRVQMGQVSFDMASKSVATGYTHLTSFTQEERSIADIAFLPDPVCARIAMSLMLEGCNLSNNSDDSSFCGESPNFWTEKAKRIFSHGLCRPQKGDVGEIAAALYMLFCGDKLRHKNDSNLTVFSISLEKWVQIMLRPGLEVSDVFVPHDSASHTASDRMSTRSCSKSVPDKVTIAPNAEATVNFIQVCRNYLRHSLKNLAEHGMLEEWYKAGRAVYSYPSCPAYDILAPVRYGDPKSYSYCALMVSVKNRLVYSKGQRESAVEAMRTVFENAGAKTGIGLLVLVGLEKDQRPLLTLPQRLFEPDSLTFVEIVVPSKDPFGVSLLADGGVEESAEVYTSHAEILASATLKAQQEWERILRSAMTNGENVQSCDVL